MDKERIKAKVGMMTLVAYFHQGDPPYPNGNCFSFGTGYKCLNMRAENAEIAFERFIDDGMVEIIVIEINNCKYALVVDDRIPVIWRKDSFCNCCVSDISQEYILANYQW